jgi:TonB family protein
MQNKNKNRKSSLADFIRYHDDKMNGKERNAFERELQKDPFAKDASEGLSSIASHEASEDIADLQKQLKKRTAKRQRLFSYRIAASVAVLMVISSIFIIKERNRSTEKIASVIDQVKPVDIPESVPITEPAAKGQLSEQPVRISEKKRERSVDLQNNPESGKASISTENNRIAAYQKIDSIPEIELKQADENLRSEQIAAVSPAPTAGKRSELREVVVTGYGAIKDESGKEDIPAGYVPPQPADGKSGFDKYIRENMQRPDTTSSGQRVVVLNFIVHTDGSVDSIKIIRSPGKQFSDEAIRLLRSGPAWKPAQDNGKIIEDRVRVRIIFK